MSHQSINQDTRAPPFKWCCDLRTTPPYGVGQIKVLLCGVAPNGLQHSGLCEESPMWMEVSVACSAASIR